MFNPGNGMVLVTIYGMVLVAGMVLHWENPQITRGVHKVQRAIQAAGRGIPRVAAAQVPPPDACMDMLALLAHMLAHTGSGYSGSGESGAGMAC